VRQKLPQENQSKLTVPESQGGKEEVKLFLQTRGKVYYLWNAKQAPPGGIGSWAKQEQGAEIGVGVDRDILGLESNKQGGIRGNREKNGIGGRHLTETGLAGGTCPGGGEARTGASSPEKRATRNTMGRAIGRDGRRAADNLRRDPERKRDEIYSPRQQASVSHSDPPRKGANKIPGRRGDRKNPL